MINYSIIIPHHNTPDLLGRCIKSIPQREDIQIIVVDDNSDPDKKPSINRKGVEVVLLDVKQSKSAGRARNVGLEHAKGQWLLFADADDMYQEGFIDVLDKELNEKVDILYFDFYNNYNIETSSDKPTRYHKFLTDYIEDPNSVFRGNRVKYGLYAPWNKVYNTNFVKSHHICFEEIPAGNDIHFVHTCGAYAKSIKCIEAKLYYYILNKSGITNRKMSQDDLLKRIKTSACHIRFIQDQGAWDIGDTSWPSISRTINMYGLLFSFRVLIMKLRFYRPSIYVKIRHLIMYVEEMRYEKKKFQ